MILRTAALTARRTSGTSIAGWRARPAPPTTRSRARYAAHLDAFSDADRAALAFTDAIVAGDVPPPFTKEDSPLDQSQRVEPERHRRVSMIVPRVLDALGVPIEHREPAS